MVGYSLTGCGCMSKVIRPTLYTSMVLGDKKKEKGKGRTEREVETGKEGAREREE